MRTVLRFIYAPLLKVAAKQPVVWKATVKPNYILFTEITKETVFLSVAETSAVWVATKLSAV